MSSWNPSNNSYIVADEDFTTIPSTLRYNIWKSFKFETGLLKRILIYSSAGLSEFNEIPEYPPIQIADKPEILNSVNPEDEFDGIPELIHINNIDSVHESDIDSDLEDLPELY